MSEFIAKLQSHFECVLLSLCEQLPNSTPQLKKAMCYSLLNGGKRIRPLLVYSAGLMMGCNLEQLDIPAAAVECLHAYSLIHDDLPAMDNDDFRRGKPSCHKAFGEAIAILAGDALQAWSFELLSHADNLNLEQRVRMMQILSTAAGQNGMVGGQALEFSLPQTPPTKDLLLDIQARKTAALFQASILLGAHGSTLLTQTVEDKLCISGKMLGLAFQIQDDLNDRHEETTALNFTQICSIAETEAHLHQLFASACEAISDLPYDVKPLLDVYHYVLADTPLQTRQKT